MTFFPTRSTVVTLVMLAALLLGGCSLSAIRRHIAPETWVNADGAPATQADTDRCKDLAQLKSASLDTLDARLASFDSCMHDHGFKMK